MKADSATLLDLSERCTTAIGPDQQLDREIRRAWKSDASPSDFTASIDTARVLVPERWRCGFEEEGRFDQLPGAEAWCWPVESDFDPDWQNGHEGYRSCPDGHRAVAATPALAIVACALKALAGED